MLPKMTKIIDRIITNLETIRNSKIESFPFTNEYLPLFTINY